jgi:cytochrome c oxidase subunit II
MPNLFLPSASANAPSTDLLLACLAAVSIAVLILVFWLLLSYVVRYRASSPVARGDVANKTFGFEMSWTAATLVVFFGLFLWGAFLYVRLFQSPTNVMRIYVVAKQWMWKVEYPGGQHEINALHVPVNRPVELLMASEDVIHDFFVPAFRVKHDVLPGRYETLWFSADRPGTYHLFCAQFCGLDHAAMTGQVVVMSPPDYQRWLQQNEGGDTLASAGGVLFMRYGCSGCHGGNGTVRAPSLNGLYGSPVPLSDGSTVIADDRYIRDSILQPRRQIVASYQPVMPSFAGVIPEDDLLKLLAYIKSLAVEGRS